MPDILLIALVTIYVIGLVTCGIAFMNDYTAQVDFMFWLLATLLWPVTWWYILIRVRNDRRAEQHRECELGTRLCPKHYKEKYGDPDYPPWW